MIHFRNLIEYLHWNMTPSTTTYFARDGKETKLYEKFLASFALGSFIVCWIFSIASPVIFVLCLWSRSYIACTFFATITYFAFAPWNKGLLCQIVNSFYFNYHCRYYKNIRIEYEGDTLPSPSDSQTFYAIHPHGAFSFGWALLFNSSALSHVRFCFSPVLYMTPFFRLFSRLIGTIGSAGKSDMISYLKKGEHLALPPGGFEEATLTSTRQDRVFIKKRHGFIRLCLKFGVAVRPVYVFGEKDLFSNIQMLKKFRLKLNRMGLPGILVWGEPLLPFLPKMNKSMHIIVGAPIALPKIENPSKDEVAKWHGKYIASLTGLFENHKVNAYGERGKDMKLEVW